MLTTAPRLQVRRPSPTTAEFTVTTLPPQTIILRLLRLLLLVLRISLSLTTLLVLHARWIVSPLAEPWPTAPLTRPEELLSLDTIWWTLDTTHRSALGQALAQIASAVPLPVLLPAAAIIFYGLSIRVYSQESLLVMRGLGVQTSESPKSYLAGTATRFIPTEKIQDILVNEAFRGFEVRYYLVVVVEGEDDLVVVFPGLLPRRAIVESVWRGARECLYEKRDDKN